ncbi:MAG: hypothetical protein IJB39_05135 [Alistipes sp.]|nr:hypothetical protein [Alistipes sp.]
MKTGPIILEGENTVSDLFERFPELSKKHVAEAIGINDKLLHQYIGGLKRPTEERCREIEAYIHSLGEALLKVKI